jgi:hypothetical protein
LFRSLGSLERSPGVDALGDVTGFDEASRLEVDGVDFEC